MTYFTAPVIVSAGEELYDRIYIQNTNTMAPTAVLVRVAGLVMATGAPGFTIATEFGPVTQQVIVEATGLVRAHGLGTGIATAATISNFGKVDAFGAYDSVGISSASTAQTLNQGTIAAKADLTATGVQLAAGGQVELLNTGSIAAEAGNRAVGVSLHAQSVTFENGASGVIRATDTSAESGAKSIGLLILSNAMRTGGSGLHNAGLIEGDTALSFDRYDYAADNATLAQRTFYNEATGVLRGAVTGSLSGEAIVNRGLIEGQMALYAGNDRYDGSAGQITDMVQGGEGNDTLIGGAAWDYLHGNQGEDSLSGGGGGDWVVGGQGNDRLFGDVGDDVVLGNMGNDTVVGDDGADQVRGGQGNDSLSAGAGNDFVSGDRGDDTISGGAGADTFHAFADAGADRILDFSRAEGDVLNLIAGSEYTVAQAGADVVVSITGGAVVTLVGVPLSSLTGDWLTVG